MANSPANESSTPGRSVESEIEMSDSGVEVGPKSRVTREESLLDTVAQEEIELEVIQEELCSSRKTRVKSQDRGGESRIEEEEVRARKERSSIENRFSQGGKMDGGFEVIESDEVDAIRADTYVEEEHDEEIDSGTVGIVDGLDGVSPQTELKEICLRIKDLEAELAKQRDASASLLSSDMELQVKLELPRLRENNLHQCKQEFIEEFDRIKKANEDRDDQHVKMHFKFVEAIKTIVGLACLSARIREPEGDAAPIHGHVLKGNEKLRESERKLDATHSKEQLLKRPIRGKDILITQNDEMFQKILDVEELNREIKVLRARVDDLEVINRADQRKPSKNKKRTFHSQISQSDLGIHHSLCVPLHPCKRTVVKSCFWELPQKVEVKINTDGAARGNPGNGGISCIFRDCDGKVLRTLVKGLGLVANYTAECKAIIQSVESAVPNGWLIAWVESDSKAIGDASNSDNIPWDLETDRGNAKKEYEANPNLC
ncbi:hypothetical protein GIB67_003693 [Kingdonia uniflora]|uniref:RNase H type-1 domain-containing protein n=1 Tax=Kingdonia uniflora TaxID=39325 RepID=A0A7J7M3V3_9MAGN|nr:hypothetical protein GIB67_003693 [Kingdonia uniflora]